MPELPEVETVVRAIRPRLLGRTFTGFWSDWPRQLATHPDPTSFRAQLVAQTVQAAGRRGKYIVLTLTHDTLLVHLKMSGHLSVVPAETVRDKWTHAVFALDNGHELRFRDTRKFGRIYLTPTPADTLGALGPEPLSVAFTPQHLADRLANRRRAIKPTLLDQTIVAGVGNIYADEALFAAGIHPETPASALDAAQVAALHGAIRSVLEQGIAREGASINSYVKPDGEKGSMQDAVNVFRRTGFPCYRCGTPIERIVLAQRSTHFCPRCQAPAV